ncbi:MAG: helix-turn-helix transcriptional regulator [Lawsonibacter sp.]|jgi:putative transcriptional regulator|nr:helix-turn-helix transcriptional regulator [Lawsonibacter sp.]
MISYEPLFKTMKERGISSYRLQKMGFNRATYYSIKSGKSVSTNTVNLLCKLLHCQVENIIAYVEDEKE